MAMVHRVLSLWCVFLLFLIFLVIRLDRQTHWFWFIVFIPFFLFDFVLLCYIIVRFVQHLKNGFDDRDSTLKRKLWFFFLVSTKLTFLFVLGAKLEGMITASYYYVFIPLWVFLIGMACDATSRVCASVHAT